MIVAPGRILTRRDQPAKATHGWQARRFGRVDGARVSRSKFFSDAKWGGPIGAYTRAELWVLKGRVTVNGKGGAK